MISTGKSFFELPGVIEEVSIDFSILQIMLCSHIPSESGRTAFSAIGKYLLF